MSEYEGVLINTESINNFNKVQENSLHFALYGVFFIQLD